MVVDEILSASLSAERNGNAAAKDNTSLKADKIEIRSIKQIWYFLLNVRFK